MAVAILYSLLPSEIGIIRHIELNNKAVVYWPTGKEWDFSSIMKNFWKIFSREAEDFWGSFA